MAWIDGMTVLRLPVPGLDHAVFRVSPVVPHPAPEAVVFTFNWLSADEDLISIRPKETEDRRLTNNAPRAAGWMAVVLPVTVVIWGLMVWFRRR